MEHALDTSANTPTWVLIVLVLTGLFSVLAVVGFVGFRWKDGLWGAILVAFNLAFAGLISMNYYEMLGQMLASAAPVGIFYWDCLVFCILIIVIYTILNLITNRISRVNVTFPQPVEMSAKPLLLVVIMVLMFMPIVHFVVIIGPTAPKPVAGRIDIDSSENFLEKVLPWAMHTASSGTLSTLGDANEFDSNNDFLLRHYKRRCALFNELYKSGSSQFSGSVEF
jgi:hypothetical protein